MNEGKKWIGLVLLDMSHVKRFSSNKSIDDINMMNTDTFEYAREQAGNEFFQKELNITDIKITESKLSKNNKNGILWVKIGNNARLKSLSSIATISQGRKLDIRLITKITNNIGSKISH